MKIMIKWQNVTPVRHFCSGFNYTNLVDFSVIPNIYQKFDYIRF